MTAQIRWPMGLLFRDLFDTRARALPDYVHAIGNAGELVYLFPPHIVCRTLRGLPRSRSARAKSLTHDAQNVWSTTKNDKVWNAGRSATAKLRWREDRKDFWFTIDALTDGACNCKTTKSIPWDISQ